MRPMLDDMELPQVQEIATRDRRALAEHKPPGMAGSLLQNMGRRPTRLILGGVANGPEALGFTERLNEKFHASEPVSFVADIVADAEIEQMLIDDLHLQELAGKPQRFAYVLVLREHLEPLEPEDAAALNSEVLGDAQRLMDDLIDGLDIGLDFATGLERFVSPLEDLLGRLRTLRQNI